MKLNHLNNLKAKTFSIELCSAKTLDTNLLSKVTAALFYSITWHTNLNININSNFAKIPAFQMAQQLEHTHTLLHLPCRYFAKETMLKALTYAKDNGIENILALHGETQKSQEDSPDFAHAVDLVRFIRVNFGETFCVGVVGYPSMHPRASSPEVDLMYLKEKVDAGADFIITQAVFGLDEFHKFYRRCREVGITVPIIPGIYVINSYNDLVSMSKMCKIVIPETILKALETIKDNDEMVHNFAISHASDLINNLFHNFEFPVNDIHVFSLNNIENVIALCKYIDL